MSRGPGRIERAILAAVADADGLTYGQLGMVILHRPFSESEVRRAAGSLKRKGLVTGQTGSAITAGAICSHDLAP